MSTKKMTQGNPDSEPKILPGGYYGNNWCSNLVLDCLIKLIVGSKNRLKEIKQSYNS